MTPRTKKTLSFSVIGTILSLSLPSCAPFSSIQGNLPDQEAITKVQTGQSTEADVLEILGPPTSSSFSNAKRWFYIGEKMERLAFFDPKVSEKEVLIIDFNPQGIVASVQFVSTPHDFNTVPQSRITKTLGKDPSFLQQIFGNFGKFSRQSEKK